MHSYLPAALNFNPRSHERSDILNGTTTDEGRISIHAPTRGATPAYITGATKADISIHAPTRGATISAYIDSPISLFQSTLPREERPSWVRFPLTHLKISIHAPTRGATRHLVELFKEALDFNPRSHERSDKIVYLMYQ